jgi:hypothetical protein
MKKGLLCALAVFMLQVMSPAQIVADNTNGMCKVTLSNLNIVSNIPRLVESDIFNLNSSSTIKIFNNQSDLFSEATVDDQGNYWGAFYTIREGKAKSVAHLGLNQVDDRRDPGIIKKIDKNSGAVLGTYEFPDVVSGVAFNPVDGLVYIIVLPSPEKLAKTSSNIAKPEVAVQSELYSLNPSSGVINYIGGYREMCMGLACSEEGNLYTLLNDGGDFYLVKFNTKIQGIFVYPIINSGNFVPSEYMDLEIDRNSGNCYFFTKNDVTDNYELRQINLSTGMTSLLSEFANDFWGGMSFQKTVSNPLNSSKIYISSPNGGEVLKSGTYQNISWRKSGTIFTSQLALEYSTNGGLTWKRIITPPIAGIMKYSWLVPNEISGNCFVRLVNYLTRAEYDRSDSKFSIVANEPATYEKAVNYPNPFNPSTKISFAIQKNAFVTLRVYNSIGQQVSELVNKQLESGQHEYVFNANNLPSGVYMYKLEIEGVSQTHKMILMK